MRLMIATLAVLAAVTSIVAYGPRFGSPAGAAPAVATAAPTPAAPAQVSPAPVAKAAPAPAAAPAHPAHAARTPSPAQAAPAVAAAARARARAALATARTRPSVGMGRVIPGTDGLRYFGGPIHGSLYGTLERHLDHDVADPLTSVVKRLLVWWVNPRRDIQAGDRLEILFSVPEGQEPVVHALTYTSAKAGRTFHAWLWKAPGARFPHYFDDSGVEVARRLVHSPVEGYEQITALLGDGRHHRGVDFKTPVGTAVHAPWSGVVRRVDWRRRLNGNCVDVHFGNGADAFFLHLSKTAKGLHPGQRVSAGQVIAYTGDTGHSFAPHLHYQLMHGRRVLNPLTFQKTFRAKVPARARADFERAKTHLEHVLAAQRHVA